MGALRRAGLGKVIACVHGDFECNRLWLLKNSITRKWPKKLCIRKPYKRLSRFA
jgi:hypothetical protein